MAVTFVTVARTDEIAPGTVKYVEIQDFRLAVCNVGGAYFCIEDTCTHDGGPLDQGTLQGEIIECPRHGARFNVTTGKVLRMPAVSAVEAFPVKIDGDQILVGLE
jgi:3-phenylpropionate/trans-cinnamate dioxygenase ferredoxin component